ncbi:MAG: helix-turn-helix domain-containing protein [Alphaproteobacteria bacterium]|nr:helix-turn-helix domain-containing protein [Alphaproteobacteria bacterium]
MPDRPEAELADFLRSRRERLSPRAVGLPAGRRRRTPGLRREEVAELAGIGVDWYVRLEQGRNVRPSAVTVDALARALKLNKTEHGHLRALAGARLSGAFEREIVPDMIRRIVEGYGHPAYITGRRFDVLAWNKRADDIFGFSRIAEADRNTFLTILTSPASRKLFGAGWPDEARRVVALFRANYDLYANDPAFVELIERVRPRCPEFVSWWRSHEVRGPSAGRKQLKHPKLGVLAYDYATFQANDDPALKLAVYTPATD